METQLSQQRSSDCKSAASRWCDKKRRSMRTEQHELQLSELPKTREETCLISELETKPETFAGETHEWRGSSFKMRQYVAAVDEELYLELMNVEANSLREMPLVWNERASEETSETACVHVDDAHERSSTPDDHEAE